MSDTIGIDIDIDNYANSNSNSINNNNSSGSITSDNNGPRRRRRLVKFVKNEPGYRISQVINAILLLNGIIFGSFTAISITSVSKTSGTDEIDLLDMIGIYFFSMWNSLVLSAILAFPSITTTHRERFLTSFYLNGLSVVLIRASDFVSPMTPFRKFVSVLIHIFSYLLFMAIFNIFYGMPDDLYEASRTRSMKPWLAIYENIQIPSEDASNSIVINNV